MAQSRWWGPHVSLGAAQVSSLTTWSNKTVFEPAGFGPNNLQSSPRQQQAEETVEWVGGVTCNPGRFPGEVGALNEGREERYQ